MKRCSKCGADKPLEAFHKDSSRKDDKASRCRECSSEDQRKRYAANPGPARENARRWYVANTEKHDENTRRWQKANPEKCRFFLRRWRESNPEKARECSRRWQKTNPEKYRENSYRSSAKLQAENYAKLVGIFGPACLDCEKEYPMHILEYHHLDPATKQGPLNVPNWAWARVEAYVQGCVQLCPTCHRLRHFLGHKKRRREGK